MQIATLVISSLSLAASVGTLAIMLKVRKDLLATKQETKTEIVSVRNKLNNAMGKFKDALGEIEL